LLTRRRFSEFVAAGAVLGGLAAPRAVAQGLGTDYDVIVVGAGVAGLVAAKRLASLASDPKVLVLEGRDRIGGRIHSVDLKGQSRDAELGALHLPLVEGTGAAAWPPIDALGLVVDTLPSGLQTLFPSMSALIRASADQSEGTVQLNSPVASVFWREGLVGVSYKNFTFESSVTARRLILTVPATVLRSGDLSITPPLPDAKLRALQTVSATPALSVAALFPGEAVTVKGDASAWSIEEPAASYRAFRMGQKADILVEAQFRGARAEALAGQDEPIVLGLALRGFAAVMDGPLTPGAAQWSAVTDWSRESYSLGARTHLADPDAAPVLAESLSGTLFFAGDATAGATADGGLAAAYASGERVAAEVARTLEADFVGAVTAPPS